MPIAAEHWLKFDAGLLEAFEEVLFFSIMNLALRFDIEPIDPCPLRFYHDGLVCQCRVSVDHGEHHVEVNSRPLLRQVHGKDGDGRLCRVRDSLCKTVYRKGGRAFGYAYDEHSGIEHMDVAAFNCDESVALFWSVDEDTLILKIRMMKEYKLTYVRLGHAHIEGKGRGDDPVSDDRQAVAHKIGIRHRVCHETVGVQRMREAIVRRNNACKDSVRKLFWR